MEDPSPVVNRSLVHISLERLDNFANQSLLEGMAAGCATVASDVGETHRVVTDEVGLLSPLEADPLADAILSLVDDPGKARKMGAAGRQRVMRNHHVDRYVDYLRLVHDLSQPGQIVDGVRLAPEPEA
jgi:glycosyltransferase involved in cell wall biosynthesis